MHASVHPPEIDELSPEPHDPRRQTAQRADRRGASPYGLGFATTGALLNHEARMAQKDPRSGWVLRPPREPKERLANMTRPGAGIVGLARVRQSVE